MRSDPPDVSFSDQIRSRASEAYVLPARKTGKAKLSIAVRDVMKEFPKDFADNRQSIFCSALRAKSFLRSNGLSLESQSGPVRGTNVVYHYTLERASCDAGDGLTTQADAEERAERLLAPLRGLLEKEIASHGGVNAYMRWVRSDEPTA